MTRYYVRGGKLYAVPEGKGSKRGSDLDLGAKVAGTNPLERQKREQQIAQQRLKRNYMNREPPKH